MDKYYKLTTENQKRKYISYIKFIGSSKETMPYQQNGADGTITDTAMYYRGISKTGEDEPYLIETIVSFHDIDTFLPMASNVIMHSKSHSLMQVVLTPGFPTNARAAIPLCFLASKKKGRIVSDKLTNYYPFIDLTREEDNGLYSFTISPVTDEEESFLDKNYDDLMAEVKDLVKNHSFGIMSYMEDGLMDDINKDLEKFGIESQDGIKVVDIDEDAVPGNQ